MHGDFNIRGYLSTASVSRDLVEIIEEVEKLKEEELASEKSTIPAHRRNSETEEASRLQYIGFSYDLQLGNTFASMFPNRVARMVLDGVVHSINYISGVSFP